MWHFLGGLEGAAKLTDVREVSALGRGQWTYVLPQQVAVNARGEWSFRAHTLGFDHNPTNYPAVLHDMAGNWRLLIPRGLETSSNRPYGAKLAVSHVYQRLPLSRKVKLVWAASPPAVDRELG